MQNYIFQISDQAKPMRLDVFLSKHIQEISREKIKKAILDGQCQVDGKVITIAGAKVKAGQSINFSLIPQSSQITPESGAIEILWQDEHMLICNKPAGITVHPCPSCLENTYIQRIAAHFPILLLQEGLRPGIVHRLDKDTSGLMLIALTEQVRLILSEFFAQRKVHKEYLAIVHGHISESGEIAEPIGRHPSQKIRMAIVPENNGGRNARSAWNRLYADANGRFSIVKVNIFTGRTHQIRVHMSHLGFPLWGDTLYGGQKINDEMASRQMLHAWHLSLPHPINGADCKFYCPVPEDFLNCALGLSQQMKKVVLTGLAGCGKSLLLSAFAEEKIPIWSADASVAKLYAVGNAGHNFFAKHYGKRFVAHAKAELDRQALRLAMQSEPLLRKEVESVIHALVREDCEEFWLKHANCPLTVAEIPLYLESGWHQQQNAYLVGIHCEQDIRYARLQKNRNWNIEQCQTIDSWQWPQDKKLATCHQVINNNGTEQNLKNSAKDLIINLQKKQNTQKDALKTKFQQLWAIP